MIKKESFKAGMIGLGFVGCSTIEYLQRSSNILKLYWLMDSQAEIHKENGSPFSLEDLEIIKNIKRKVPRGSLEEIKSKIQYCKVEPLETTKERVHRIKELRNEIGSIDIVIDASSARTKDSFEIAMAVLNSTSLCTANKQAWKEHSLASKMMRVAMKNKVHIGLNCTVGVYANQFEYFPIALLGLKSGRLILRKRDNASLNTFLKLIREGYRPRQAMHILFQKNYLEPGGGLTPAEVLDQEYKVLIISIIASNILKELQVNRESKLEIVYPEGLDEIYKCTPEDMANWVWETEKKGKRAVVISKVVCDLENKKITQQLAFRGLRYDDLLSSELDGESAICIDVDDSEKLVWEAVDRKLELRTLNDEKEYIFHKGPGAGVDTGRKIIEEAIRICRLRKRMEEENKPYVSYLPSVQELFTFPDRAREIISEMESKKKIGPNLKIKK